MLSLNARQTTRTTTLNVGDVFQTFCKELALKDPTSISNRYKAITKRLNLDFWNNSYDDYVRYNAYSSNGQSALLQDMRNSIKKTYSVTDIGADGQVAVVPFDDG